MNKNVFYLLLACVLSLYHSYIYCQSNSWEEILSPYGDYLTTITTHQMRV